MCDGNCNRCGRDCETMVLESQVDDGDIEVKEAPCGAKENCNDCPDVAHCDYWRRIFGL